MFRCASRATRLVWVKARALLNTGVLGMFRSSVPQLGTQSANTSLNTRVPIGKMVFEVGGGGLRQEIAQAGASSFLRPSVTSTPTVFFYFISRAALRLAAAKMPVKSEFVTRQSQEARVGKMTVPTQLIKDLPEGQPTDNATAKMPSDTKTGTVAENVRPGEA